MYSAAELKELTLKPRINDISLKVLSEYYEMFLNPFIYHYRVRDIDGERAFELRFECENFCHLLGIETTAKYHVPRKDLHNYKGIKGWNNVVNKVIDIPHLKKLNKSKFASMKAKYVYFYLLPNLIEHPMAVSYDKSSVGTATNIECEILFFSKVEGDNAIIHLGLEKTDANYYIPRTFFVEKVADISEDIYINQQIEIEVNVQSRTILL